jgi:hypothetical protein
MKANMTGKKTIAGVAATAAAAGAAAVGYYFYASKDAVKHRKIAVKWARDLKQDVATGVKKIKKIDRAAVAAVVDGVAKTYHGVRTLDRKEVERAARELKNNWEMVVKEFNKQPMVKSVKKTVKKNVVVMKKSAAKTIKKAKRMIA